MAEEPKSQLQIANDWLQYTISDWRKELRSLKIKSTDELYDSFQGSVIQKADNSFQVNLAYAWYGQMVDGGWGRGSSSADKQDNAVARRLLGSGAGFDRKPKPWYTKGKAGIAHQTHRLGELIGLKASAEAVGRITNSISLNHTINFR